MSGAHAVVQRTKLLLDVLVLKTVSVLLEHEAKDRWDSSHDDHENNNESHKTTTLVLVSRSHLEQEENTNEVIEAEATKDHSSQESTEEQFLLEE